MGCADHCNAIVIAGNSWISGQIMTDFPPLPKTVPISFRTVSLTEHNISAVIHELRLDMQAEFDKMHKNINALMTALERVRPPMDEK
jgi:hypothetical protein